MADSGTPGSSAYRAAGVDYESLDAGKRNALTEALATSSLLAEAGGRALDESRGEPAFVFEAGGQTLAFVVEGLGTKSIIARQVEEQVGVSAFDNVAYDTVAAIVNDSAASARSRSWSTRTSRRGPPTGTCTRAGTAEL